VISRMHKNQGDGKYTCQSIICTYTKSILNSVDRWVCTHNSGKNKDFLTLTLEGRVHDYGFQGCHLAATVDMYEKNYIYFSGMESILCVVKVNKIKILGENLKSW